MASMCRIQFEICQPHSRSISVANGLKYKSSIYDQDGIRICSMNADFVVNRCLRNNSLKSILWSMYSVHETVTNIILCCHRSMYRRISQQEKVLFWFVSLLHSDNYLIGLTIIYCTIAKITPHSLAVCRKKTPNFAPTKVCICYIS